MLDKARLNRVLKNCRRRRLRELSNDTLLPLLEEFDGIDIATLEEVRILPF